MGLDFTPCAIESDEKALDLISGDNDSSIIIPHMEGLLIGSECDDAWWPIILQGTLTL